MREFVHPDRLLEAGLVDIEQTGPLAGPERRWEGGLRELLADRRTPFHLVGVGNPMRRDDGVGLEIISQLLRRLGRRRPKNVILHPPTDTADRVLSRIDCTSERLLIFDAVEASGMPGRIILASLADSKFGFFATHNVPLRIIPGLAANPSNVFVAGIEPELLDVGEGLSEVVRSSADDVVSVVVSALGGGTDGLP